ncbi:hypothetical protein SAICODRAFT_29900 [Saitoella complicata NRRL Y-17804]|nr:uncharacterized protein SAICODRAFT_29900 [Saitoella complicata NRRL Y-17804]ODQ53968.1 hypothetical protein SAICODRAFT_29900 [Saitoella complicata NRRL Y-17804]
MSATAADVRRLLRQSREQRRAEQTPNGTKQKRQPEDAAVPSSKRTRTTSPSEDEQRGALPADLLRGRAQKVTQVIRPVSPSPEEPSNPNALPADFFDPGNNPDVEANIEDEWAAFQAEIAQTTAAHANTISVAPTTAGQNTEPEHKPQEEDEEESPEELRRRKLEDEIYEQMSLEERVQKLKEKRAQIKQQAAAAPEKGKNISSDTKMADEVDESDDEDEDDFMWRSRGG